MGIFDVFGEIFFLWKFLLIVVLSGWIFTRVGSKLLATAMVSFVFWIVLTSNWLAMAATVLYMVISFVLPHGFESMIMLESAHGMIQQDKAYSDARRRMQQQEEVYRSQMRDYYGMMG